jgi:hypothetical protein
MPRQPFARSSTHPSQGLAEVRLAGEARPFAASRCSHNSEPKKSPQSFERRLVPRSDENKALNLFALPGLV